MDGGSDWYDPGCNPSVRCPRSIWAALRRYIGRSIEVFTAASDDVIGPDDRIGVLQCVGDNVIVLKPLCRDNNRVVYLSLDSILGFQTANYYRTNGAMGGNTDEEYGDDRAMRDPYPPDEQY
jgi:hypothetical protein